jgi:hypothetical protein
VGIEVLLRMCRSVLFWEFGKYAIIYFILLSILRTKRNININIPILTYLLLLLPAIINLPLDSINIWRQNISFNLSGPVCLTCLTFYFSNKQIRLNDLIDIFFFNLLPILSMSIVIFLKMPDVQSYHFMPYSDPTTSGGYGPNQVSTIFGFVITGIFFAQLFKKNITGYRLLDLLCLIIFIGLGLITFSRGGLFAAIISVVIAFSFYFYHDQRKIQFFIKTFIILIITILTWFAIVSITDGAISKRYGLSGGTYGERFVLDLTGRAQIYKIDIEIFYDYFLTGVGPGQAPKLREIYGYGKRVAAHTEYSRMLAEHGFLGLFSLVILTGIPIYYIFSMGSPDTKIIKILFGLLALLTMFHSAMRISMPCFVYALQFINLEEV